MTVLESLGAADGAEAKFPEEEKEKKVRRVCICVRAHRWQ